MDRDELKERLLATFLGELEEHVRALEANALALEKAPIEGRAELLKTLFRTAHSLKGASRSAGVSFIEGTCHRLEELLAGARDGVVPVSADLVQTLLSAADALADAGRRVRAKEDLQTGPLAALLARLERNRPSAIWSASPPVAPPSAPRVVATAAASPAEVAPGTVRLPATRLDALVARSGELLVARQRAARRQDELWALRETVTQCLADWRRLEKPLFKLMTSPPGTNGGARASGVERALPKRTVAAIHRTRENLKRLERDVEHLAHGLTTDLHGLAQTAAPLEDEVRHVRMLRFADACEGLERAVRDLARAANKDIQLVVEGADVELDRAILAALRDPLLHLVRNAADHGIETPEERRARGKPTRGRITVSAALKGAGVEVVVADDGRGLDLESIREQARRRKHAVPEDERELVRLIFQAGFSTARLITNLSGRGVGLDVVKHGVEALRGTVDVSFEPGRGTRFSLALPLTLTTLRALLVGAGGQTFAIPTTAVIRLVRAGPGDIGCVKGREVLLGGSSPVPVASLADTLGLPAITSPRAGDKVPLVVVGADERQLAFAVDELIAEQDVVIKNLGRRLRRVRHFSGATVLATGRLCLIVAPAELVQTAVSRAPTRLVSPSLDDEPQPARKRLLVADDSVTTRSLEKSILEGAGYEVLTAADGAEAWQLLQEKGADLVVADVEMPRMDGFALTEAIRGSKRFRDLPVVLVTALETERDKARGLEVGADAYLPKSVFDQRLLLEVVGRLL